MSRRKGKWTKRVVLLFVFALLIGVGKATAADFRSGDTVVVPADEVVDDDLFASGRSVLIQGTVTGDLIAGATEVVITGVVEGSVFIGANNVRIDGDVDGSAYAGIYSLTFGESATVGRNVYVGGFNVDTQSGSSIGRSLYASTYQTLVNGSIAGDAVVNSAALQLGGDVGGDVRAEVASGDQSMMFTNFMPTFAEEFRILAPGFQRTDEATVGGELDVVETAVEEDNIVDLLIDRLGELIALLLVGALWIFMAPVLLARAGTVARNRPLPSAGLGCLTTLLFPLIALLLAALIILLVILGGFVTAGQLTGELIGLGGAGFALFVTGFALVFSILSKVVVSYLVGRLILGRSAPATQATRTRHFTYLVLGALAYEILRAIPVLGILVAAIVILLGLGAIILAARRQPAEPATIAVKTA